MRPGSLTVAASWLLYAAGLTTAQKAYADNRVPLEKDEEQVAAHFPDVRSEKLYAPAFLAPQTIPDRFAEGTASPTNTSILDLFLKSIADNHKWANLIRPNTTNSRTEENRFFSYLYLTDDPAPSWGNKTVSPKKKLRIWIQSAVHGNEPAGDQAVMALAGKFENDTNFRNSVLKVADVILLPRYNPDGVIYFQKDFASNVDPDMDVSHMKSKQTGYLRWLVGMFTPHIFIDAHEYMASQRMGPDPERPLLAAQDSRISAAKNLNIHEDVRKLSQEVFVQGIGSTLDAYELRWGPSFNVVPENGPFALEEPSSTSRTCHAHAALHQTVSILSETRGTGLGDQHFQRRVTTGLLVMETVLRTAVTNFDTVHDTIERARNETAQPNNDNDIVVTDCPKKSNTTWEFIDAKSGELVREPVTFVNHTWPKPDLTRPRPVGYIFSRAYGAVAERLRLAGVRVITLNQDYRAEVEALRVETAEVLSKKFEGVAETKVTTQAFRKNVTIVKGGWAVPMAQPNAAIAAVSLEPENLASFARYNIVPLEEGDEYPIFRVMEDNTSSPPK